MNASDLVVGNVYFVCSWLSLEKPVPEITAWVYTGIASIEETDTKHCFQDSESFFLNEILAELSAEQQASYEKPGGPKLYLVKESELPSLVYSLDEMKDFVSELGTEKNAEQIYGSQT